MATSDERTATYEFHNQSVEGRDARPPSSEEIAQSALSPKSPSILRPLPPPLPPPPLPPPRPPTNPPRGSPNLPAAATATGSSSACSESSAEAEASTRRLSSARSRASASACTLARTTKSASAGTSNRRAVCFPSLRINILNATTPPEPGPVPTSATRAPDPATPGAPTRAYPPETRPGGRAGAGCGARRVYVLRRGAEKFRHLALEIRHVLARRPRRGASHALLGLVHDTTRPLVVQIRARIRARSLVVVRVRFRRLVRSRARFRRRLRTPRRRSSRRRRLPNRPPRPPLPLPPQSRPCDSRPRPVRLARRARSSASMRAHSAAAASHAACGASLGLSSASKSATPWETSSAVSLERRYRWKKTRNRSRNFRGGPRSKSRPHVSRSAHTSRTRIDSDGGSIAFGDVRSIAVRRNASSPSTVASRSSCPNEMRR